MWSVCEEWADRKLLIEHPAALFLSSYFKTAAIFHTKILTRKHCDDQTKAEKHQEQYRARTLQQLLPRLTNCIFTSGQHFIFVYRSNRKVYIIDELWTKHDLTMFFNFLNISWLISLILHENKSLYLMQNKTWEPQDQLLWARSVGFLPYSAGSGTMVTWIRAQGRFEQDDLCYTSAWTKES